MVRLAAAKPGVPSVAIWSCAEFEEYLRIGARIRPAVLVEGIPFPESEGELRNFVDKFQDVNDVQGSLVGIAVAEGAGNGQA